MKQRDEYIVECKIHNPRPVKLICDATFYGKRKDKLGTLAFKDNESKEILTDLTHLFLEKSYFS